MGWYWRLLACDPRPEGNPLERACCRRDLRPPWAICQNLGKKPRVRLRRRVFSFRCLQILLAYVAIKSIFTLICWACWCKLLATEETIFKGFRTILPGSFALVRFSSSLLTVVSQEAYIQNRSPPQIISHNAFKSPMSLCVLLGGLFVNPVQVHTSKCVSLLTVL